MSRKLVFLHIVINFVVYLLTISGIGFVWENSNVSGMIAFGFRTIKLGVLCWFLML